MKTAVLSIFTMSRHQQGNKKLTLTITSGGFHLGTTWPPLLEITGGWYSRGVSNLCRKLESDQCQQVLQLLAPAVVAREPHFDGGQVPQRCLVSKFMSSIKCFSLLPQLHAQQGTSLFWLSQCF